MGPPELLLDDAVVGSTVVVEGSVSVGSREVDPSVPPPLLEPSLVKVVVATPPTRHAGTDGGSGAQP
jgi:hypothetical protein